MWFSKQGIETEAEGIFAVFKISYTHLVLRIDGEGGGGRGEGAGTLTFNQDRDDWRWTTVDMPRLSL